MAKKPRPKPAARRAGPLFLTEWMEEQKVSDIELAKRLGVSPVTVWRWQKSSTRLNPLKQAQVGLALGIWPGALWMHPASKAMRMIRLVLEDETSSDK
jgi:transcriptional regulator with XRE-family HTH domain